mgnify:FL=1
MHHHVKRALLCGAAAASLMFAGGCNAALPFTGNSVDLDRTYTADAEITCGKTNAAAEITRCGGGEWKIAFTEPKSLAGIKLSLDENGYTAELGELTFTAENNAEYTTAAEIIASAIDDIAENGTGGTVEDGVLSFNSDFGGKNIVVSVSEETGELVSLKCPSYRLAVYFSGQEDFTPIDPDEGGLVEE